MKKPRPRISIPAATWAYLFILSVVIVGSVMREINLLMILAGLLCAPVIINWHVARTTLRDLSIHRRLPTSVFAGEPLTVEVVVSNHRRLVDSWGLVLQDRLRKLNGATSLQTMQQFSCFVPHLAIGQEQSVRYQTRLWQRGRHRFGPLRVSTQAPLGLIQGQVVFRDTDEIIVLPQPGQLTSQWANLIAADRTGQRATQRRFGPTEGDFYGLREWRAGDNRRLVHWRSSAKRQTLMVRQFERRRGQNYLVLLDLGRLHASSAANGTHKARLLSALASAPNTDSEETVERAIRFTATILTDLCQRGAAQLALGIASREVVWRRASASPVALREWLEILAEAEGTTNDPWPDLLQQMQSHVGRDEQPIVVSVESIPWQDRQRFPDEAAGPNAIAWSRAIGVSVKQADFQQLYIDSPQPTNPSANQEGVVPSPHFDRVTVAQQ